MARTAAHACQCCLDTPTSELPLSASRSCSMLSLNASADVSGWRADPILAYKAGAEVNQLQWSVVHHDWVAICFANRTQILRV